MISVLLAAAGAPWEAAALAEINGPTMVVMRRCLDIDELLATAATGQAHAAVVALEAPGLDVPAAERLRGYGVAVVAVAPTGLSPDEVAARADRLGVAMVPADQLEILSAIIDEIVGDVATRPAVGVAGGGHPVIAVWGPAGAPGRTTIAIGMAAELAARSVSTVLVDADPYGGVVAAALGILDEVSGLLAAARPTGSVPGSLRAVGPRLSVLTGLPRGDRWIEVRPGALEDILRATRAIGPVVVDTGFCLEDDPGAEFAGRAARNTLTLEATRAADRIVVVGTPDPIGLARLARGLTEIREHRSAPVEVVLNRVRSSLGWSSGEITELVRTFAPTEPVHLIPHDLDAVDRAMLTGRTLAESGPSRPVTVAIAGLVDSLFPASAHSGARGRRDRRRRPARR